MARLNTQRANPNFITRPDNARPELASNTGRGFLGKHIPLNIDYVNELDNNAALASAISGTTNKNSKEYKAAIRSIQKLRKGDIKNPGRSKYASSIMQALGENNQLPSESLDAAKDSFTGSLSVNFTGWISVDNYEPRFRTISFTLDNSEALTYLDNIDNSQQALNSLFTPYWNGANHTVQVYGAGDLRLS